jgi:NADPH:quinone reductase-like Zn-dependent oxidoreductase
MKACSLQPTLNELIRGRLPCTTRPFCAVRRDLALPLQLLTLVLADAGRTIAVLLQVNPVTVYGMLQNLNLPKGGYVVFSAAGSALSHMGIHLAKHYGLKTIGIVRRDEQREEVLQHGADAAVSSASEDVVARIKEITGGKVCHVAHLPLACTTCIHVFLCIIYMLYTNMLVFMA